MEKNIKKNKELNIFEAIIPVIFLMILLAYNIFYADGVLLGDYSNQFILLFSAGFALIVGLLNKVGIFDMFREVLMNFKSVLIPILILLLVGALSGTWLVSGIIPAMVYYGLQILNPAVFLPASMLIASLISLATGSSWTTSATVGIALIGIGTALGIPVGMIAGAVISGAYFGDKLSPLSDTTNLAPAMAGTDLYTHIRYMTYTTIPTYVISIFIFSVLGFFTDTKGVTDVPNILISIEETFVITPLLFAVPALVIVLILFKTKPLIALSSGIFLAVGCAFYFQPKLLASLSESNLKSILNVIWSETSIATDNEALTKLYNAKGMLGMLWTILLILSAMVFGGIMEAMGALGKITAVLLSFAKSVFGLFLSTALSCIGLNVIASDQYLAIVIPGKMYKNAFKEKGLAPENLSRTLEDAGTVTSVLIPWNTCGAYQSEVLGVGVGEYFMYAIFNWLSPITTLLFAAFHIKIRTLIPAK
ncbi:MAG: Na+/H+ antiporter NhaC family protein [Flavobacterium sp.]